MAESSNSDCNSNVCQEESDVVVEEEVLASINDANDVQPRHRGIADDDDDDGPPTKHHEVDDVSIDERENTAAAVLSSQLEMIEDYDGPPTQHQMNDGSHEKRKNTAAAVISSQLEMIDDDVPPIYHVEDDSHEKRKNTAAAVLSSQLETIEDDDSPPTYHLDDDDADQKRAAVSSFCLTNVEPNPPTPTGSIQAKIAAYRIANEEKCEEGCDMSDDESISYEQSTSNYSDEQGVINLNASVQVDENDEEEDIESGIQRESSQPQAITGFLVGEENDDVVTGVAETILPWWKQRRGKILITLICTFLPILVMIVIVIYNKVKNGYLGNRSYGIIHFVSLVSLGMLIFCGCWNFGQQCRPSLKCCSRWESVMDLREDRITVQSKPEHEDNAMSMRSSINRETSISASVTPIIPEACLVEEVDENNVNIAGVAEPIPPWWEQRKRKTILRSIFLTSTIFLLVMVIILVFYPLTIFFVIGGIAMVVFLSVLCTYTKEGCSCKVSTERMVEE